MLDPKLLEVECEDCTEKFIIKYTSKDVPAFCTFCGEDLILTNANDDEELEDEFFEDEIDYEA